MNDLCLENTLTLDLKYETITRTTTFINYCKDVSKIKDSCTIQNDVTMATLHFHHFSDTFLSLFQYKTVLFDHRNK